MPKPVKPKEGKPRNHVHEMMTRIEFNRGTKNHRVLRVWTSAQTGGIGPDPRVLDALGTQRNPIDVVDHVTKIMEKLGPEIVAAYELLDDRGHGFVDYPDWN